jgi:type III pantothenate kinase
MTAEFLLIDISNSFTKLALASRDALRVRREIATAKLTDASLTKLVRGWKFERVVLSSVVPKKNKHAASLKKPVLRVNAKINLGVGIDPPQPEKIGADRLANAAAVAALFGTPAVVVDFGTAVTFDIISPGKKYIGGVIAPGLAAMTSYLFEKTALLPRIDLREPVGAIGKSTRAAMMAGAVFGYRGLVREILAQVKRELGTTKKLCVVATGGYAKLIAAKLREIEVVHPNLTLEGLRIIGVLNS